MYSEYTSQLQSAFDIVQNLYNKNKKFATVVDEIQAMPECGHIKLMSHMGTLWNRIAKYKLFFERYLKSLPEGSVDSDDAKLALEKISDAASHLDNAGTRLQKFNKLMEVQQSLGGTVDLVSPTRELLKEGKITKISARSGDHQERYLFLVTSTATRHYLEKIQVQITTLFSFSSVTSSCSARLVHGA